MRDTWTLGGKALPEYEGWQAIKIVYPQDKESNKANFKIKCEDATGLPGIPVKEDCVSFNPATTEVKNVGGRWKIVDRSHWMFDFGNKESEAKQALAIIKKYGFTHSCFVGKPDP